jgi:uncharacterized membrane protein (DUF2068 family)
MRLWPKHWHAETWVCAMRGHVTPAAYALELGPGSEELGVTLADGRRLARCLRCDTWIEHEPPDPATAQWAVLPPLAELAKPRRGHQLEEAIVMRVIALNKALHATIFTLLAIGLALLDSNLSHIHRWADHLIQALSGPLDDTGQQASRSWLARQAHHLFDLQPNAIKLLLILALAYAVTEWTEAVGLWLEKRWAEYLTVLATTGFLPLEVHELIERVTAVRIIALVINVALIVWLLVNKHLFGLRGGPATLRAESAADWDAIVAAPTPAHRR